MLIHLVKSAMMFGLQRARISQLPYLRLPSLADQRISSPTPRHKNALTPVFSACCSLFVPLKHLRPFIISILQPLFPKHPGGVGSLVSNLGPPTHKFCICHTSAKSTRNSFPCHTSEKQGGGGQFWLTTHRTHAVVAPASCWRVAGPQFFSFAPLLKSRKAVLVTVADPVKQTAYLSLGSNVGERARNLRDAIAALGHAGARVVRVSSTYETEPVDYLEQPWFLNCAVEAETELAALDLLHALRGIETRMGSKKLIAKGPRLLDIDILLYGNEVIDTPGLQVPHPRMHLRRFALQPLAEIAPSLQHPVSGLSISELLARTPDKSAVRVASGLQPGQYRGAL